MRLSRDHKPDLPGERARIERSGGYVVQVRGLWRVTSASGVGVSLKRPTVSLYLAVSRAIGDLTLKTPSPIVSARPEVRIERLRGDDLFVVVACDGIWDVLSDQAAVDIAAEHVHSPQEAAQAIVRAALAKGSGDNLTVTVVVFGWQIERASALLEGKATTKAKAITEDEIDIFG